MASSQGENVTSVTSPSSSIAIVWMQVVTEDWVRSAAERYADQFFITARGYQRASGS